MPFVNTCIGRFCCVCCRYILGQLESALKVVRAHNHVCSDLGNSDFFMSA